MPKEYSTDSVTEAIRILPENPLVGRIEIRSNMGDYNRKSPAEQAYKLRIAPKDPLTKLEEYQKFAKSLKSVCAELTARNVHLWDPYVFRKQGNGRQVMCAEDDLNASLSFAHFILDDEGRDTDKPSSPFITRLADVSLYPSVQLLEAALTLDTLFGEKGISKIKNKALTSLTYGSGLYAPHYNNWRKGGDMQTVLTGIFLPK